MRLRNFLCDYVLFNAIVFFCEFGTSYLCARFLFVCETSFVDAKLSFSVRFRTLCLNAIAKSHKQSQVAQHNKKSQAKL